MNHRFSRVVASFVFACTTAGPVALWAQDSDPAGMFYSQGVLCFFAGRLAEADSYLSRAIAINSNDPRPYYFRSLSRLREGRSAEARADMQTGAEAEARLPNRFAIGKVLERVQGPDRLLLEQYRRIARLSSVSAGNSSLSANPIDGRDAAVLRERRLVPLEEFLQPGAPRSVAVQETAPARPSAPAAPMAKPTDNQDFAPAAAADPFSDDASPRARAADKAPAAKAPEPAAKTPAPLPTPPQSPPPAQPQQKPPEKDDNPFL